MSDQCRKLHPTGQLTDCQSAKSDRGWYRLGLSLGLAVLGLGRLRHNPAWAFPANPSDATLSNHLSKISLPEKQQAVWSISQHTFPPSLPMLSQPQSPSGVEEISGLIEEPSPSIREIEHRFLAEAPFTWIGHANQRSSLNQDFGLLEGGIAQATALSGKAKLPPKQPTIAGFNYIDYTLHPTPYTPPSRDVFNPSENRYNFWRQEFRSDNFDGDPEYPTEVSTVGDPELGILRLKEKPLPVLRQPVLYLLGGVDYLSSDNIFLETDPVNDQFVQTGLSLVAVPPLGPQTSLFALVGGSLLRYSRFTDSDYNDLRFQVGVTQRLLPQTYGKLSWSNRQLFESGEGDRFFNDHSIQLALGRRDQLLPLLGLDSFYQLRFSFSDPNDFSRFIQTLGVSLSYDIAPELQLALSYQLTLADFTQQARYDTFNQLFGQVTFNLTSSSRFNLFGGFSFGDSSKSAVGFDDTIFGLSLDVDLPLF